MFGNGDFDFKLRIFDMNIILEKNEYKGCWEEQFLVYWILYVDSFTVKKYFETTFVSE